MVLVVNPSASSGTGNRVITQVRHELPKAEIVGLGANDSLPQVLRAAAERAEVLGIGGGEGTVACAAAVAVDTGRPLAVFPAGTCNHFAQDIGCDDAAKTIQAIREGPVSCVDLVSFNGQQMVNTVSIGAYPRLVRCRPANGWTTRSASRSRRRTQCFTNVRREDPAIDPLRQQDDADLNALSEQLDLPAIRASHRCGETASTTG
jgi:diacylglycerol kinase family enzyme